ncbi:uncharacterized protein LOC9637859 isoform X2 [Selaginella moellendorffii]|uniref:uncharacterized protein LOC9637859 isoform X2 n=1 Tax=Selaginella moellendorffii TaxID=88036 RepID=UPI000D1D1290|nr:uncharacterized protein LOC9637859 isoform X2 [Selaginella moellendorffii]|eukprot:XP_024535874.1 uncharacterized protein LOC9637859 isoform X2 [Selaginella moellendorffii]
MAARVCSTRVLAPWGMLQRRIPVAKFAAFPTPQIGEGDGDGESNSAATSIAYLRMSERDLVAQCKMDTFRATGPGGQHRNKTESAASEDRSQHRNRESAVQRLRHTIAIKLRSPVNLEGYVVAPELAQILPLKETRKSSRQLGPNHPDYLLGLQLLLDLIDSVGGSVSIAAEKLGLSTGSLSKVITSDNSLLVAVNEIRASRGLKPLRA